MGRLRTALAVLTVMLSAGMGFADDDAPRLTGALSIRDDGGAVKVDVPLSSAVPWKVWVAGEPPRLVLEISGVDLGEMPVSRSQSISEITAERHSPEVSRIIVFLREPLMVDTAEMITIEDGSSRLELSLAPASAAEFLDLAKPLDVAVEPPIKARPVVMIDPGHGGRDPGADAGELNEADLMLEFALKLRDELEATTAFDVVLTRETDIFVPLDERLSRARAAKADVFLSLHADRLAADFGRASGITIYTLAGDAAADADDRQSQRGDTDDILKGVDLSGTSDQLAMALMALQRQDTDPRAAALSLTLIEAFGASGLAVNSRPERQGDFAVLRAADIPSVLIELGFLSSNADLARLTSSEWQTEAAFAIRDGLQQWLQEDAILGQSLRK
ncbi:N-acetylmuramoyl-L-alanine amidase [Rhodobacteraceae bacterium]|nr:N-acetylmuramoyl-L-alanine amidase [Paracoccaceae bacterium]